MHDLKPKNMDKVREDAMSMLEKVKSGRQSWESKVTRHYKRRFGMRAAKSFPWPGCSNLHFPLIDRTIRRLKASYIRLITNSWPIATIQASDTGLGREIEYFLDWLIRVRMDPIRSLIMVTDFFLSFGRSAVKTTWNYETRPVTEKHHISEILPEREFEKLKTAGMRELFPLIARMFDLDPTLEEDVENMKALAEQIQQGKKILTLTHDVIVHDEPKVTAVHPLDLYVPSNTTEIESAQFIAHRMFLPSNILAQRKKAKFYRGDAVDRVMNAIDEMGPQWRTIEYDSNRDTREDITTGIDAHELAEIYEIYFYYDWNKDGVGEPCVLTLHPDTDSVLRFIEYPYAHGEWPFVDFEAEITDGRWYSPRGYAELLEALQVEINAQHNAKIDAMTLTNAPIGFYARNSGFDPEDLLFVPGQFIPLQNPSSDIIFPVIPSHEISYEREEQSLKLWSEEISGTLDAAITAPSQTMERRTATEIEAVQMQTSSIFGLDAAYFQSRMRRVYRQILALWQQYGEDNVEIPVVGRNLPIRFGRQKLMGQYDIIPTGTPANTTESARIGRALQFLQIAGQMQAPNVDYNGLIRRIAQLLDPDMAREIITDAGSSTSQVEYEKQIDEIVRMITIQGWYEEVEESEDHQAHAKAVQDYLSNAGQQLQGSEVGNRIMRHGLEHQAKLKQGGKGEKVQQAMPMQQAPPQGGAA